MNIVISTKNIALTDEMKATIEEKISHLKPYVSEETPIHVTLESHPKYEKVDVMINHGGRFLKAERTAQNINRALYLAVRKMKKTLERFIFQRSKKDSVALDQWGTKYPLFAEEATEEEELLVIKRKSFNMKPMMEEEAILQMEMLGHSFFMFLNGETNKTCLLYKRNDGHYGLIEAIH